MFLFLTIVSKIYLTKYKYIKYIQIYFVVSVDVISFYSHMPLTSHNTYFRKCCSMHSLHMNAVYKCVPSVNIETVEQNVFSYLKIKNNLLYLESCYPFFSCIFIIISLDLYQLYFSCSISGWIFILASQNLGVLLLISINQTFFLYSATVPIKSMKCHSALFVVCLQLL